MQGNPRQWGDKPFVSLNYHLRKAFGEKVYKISLNGGMTCPNRDGTVGQGGCIFCSHSGSGDFTSSSDVNIPAQIAYGREMLQKKYRGGKYIAYFQSYTNTYAQAEYLRKIYTEALAEPDIVAVSIATRPDCLGPEVLSLLQELRLMKPVWVELGLQTVHDKTATLINRGYPMACFQQGVNALAGIDIPVIVHTILGLPSETGQMMLETIRTLSAMPISGIKLHLLYVLKDTVLERMYLNGEYEPLSRQEYIEILIECIEHLPEHIVIHRITGDPPREFMTAPEWSVKKWEILNQIMDEFRVRNTWQGKKYRNGGMHHG